MPRLQKAETEDARVDADEAAREARAERELAAAMEGTLEAPVVYRGRHVYPDVAHLRREMGLSQADFAERFGFSVRTVQNWEQGRRLPEKSARLLLRAIAAAPGLVSQIAAEDADVTLSAAP